MQGQAPIQPVGAAPRQNVARHVRLKTVGSGIQGVILDNGGEAAKVAESLKLEDAY